MLDALYIPKRYPDSPPEGAPTDYFGRLQSSDAISHARALVEVIHLALAGDPWQRRSAMEAPQIDAIVVLSGGRYPAPGPARLSEWHDPDRFLAGLDLFRAGKAPRLLPARQSRVLLVTSTFHMRRAQRLFERQGLKVLPFPVDFQSRGRCWAGPLWRDPTQWLP